MGEGKKKRTAAVTRGSDPVARVTVLVTRGGGRAGDCDDNEGVSCGTKNRGKRRSTDRRGHPIRPARSLHSHQSLCSSRLLLLHHRRCRCCCYRHRSSSAGTAEEGDEGGCRTARREEDRSCCRCCCCWRSIRPHYRRAPAAAVGGEEVRRKSRFDSHLLLLRSAASYRWTADLVEKLRTHPDPDPSESRSFLLLLFPHLHSAIPIPLLLRCRTLPAAGEAAGPSPCRYDRSPLLRHG